VLFKDILPRHVHGGTVTGKRFVDLGSGDGRAVFQAAKAGMRATGLENNWYLYALSQFTKYKPQHASSRKNVHFSPRSFYKYSCSEQDVVMIFGVTEIMPTVSAKLLQELPPSGVVVSSQFEFLEPGWDLLEQCDDFNVYKKETLSS
jgi:hypothetical protein